MNAIEVCFTPDLIEQHELNGKIAIVTDIFRATTCMVSGLANGVESITPVISVEECLSLQKLGYLAGGERHAQRIEGFDLDNSPFSYMREEVKGKKIAMTTTNGTLSINKAKPTAKEVWVGAFLNLSAVANALQKENMDVVVICAGWKGRPGLEDILFAGALVEKLKDSHEVADDSALMAHRLFLLGENNLLNYVQGASHLKRLKNLGGGLDIPHCLAFDQYDILAVMNGDELVLRP